MSKELQALQSYVQSNEPIYPSDKAYNIIKSALERLEKHKQIEKELGVDLITLFKALENGVWNLVYDERVITHDDVIIYDLTKFKTLNEEDIYFKDYGKTWALTKEELENDERRTYQRKQRT